ncbi:MAG: hypothetical protein J1E41_04770 [Ruminococcus sp.]|nr:hypothetical protein [Ruminococcus sp.]
MKKILSSALIIIFLLSFVSCVPNNEKDFKYNPYAKTLIYKELPNYGYVDLYEEKFSEFGDLDISYNASTEPYKEPDLDDEEYFYDEEDEEETLSDEEYEKQEKVRAFAEDSFYEDFRNNQVRYDDFIVTKFKDGWCINQYVYDKKKFKYKKGYFTDITIEIPREIEGKKVLKLGCYIERNKCENYKNEDTKNYLKYFKYENSKDYCEFNYVQKGFLCTVPEELHITLKIPDTVTDISYKALDSYDEYIPDDAEGYFDSKGYVTGIEVDKNNSYYKSQDGVMFSKDGEWLLYLRPKYLDNYKKWKFTVPDSVKYIANTHICDYVDNYHELTIGRNVKKIYSSIWFGECGITNCIFYVYKNSYVQKWLEAQREGYILINE